MTAMAPQPHRSRQSPAGSPPGQPAWQTRPAAQARGTAGTPGGAPAAERAVTPRGKRGRATTPRPGAARSTPAQLRIARAVAAGVCLLPGTAALVALTSATTADPANAPALVRADINRHAAVARADAAVAWTTGSADDRVRVARDLTEMSAAFGRAEAVRPDWATRVRSAKQVVAAESSVILSALAAAPANSGNAPPATGTTGSGTTGSGTTGSGASAAAAGKLQESLNRLVAAPQTLPPLTDETGNDARRAVVLTAAALALGGLLGASVWLARKTHRVVNPGLGLALLGTVAVGIVAGQTLAGMVTSSTAETIAGVRVNAATATAAEVSPLLPGVSVGTAAQEASTATTEGNRKVTALGDADTSRAWREFTAAPLLKSQTRPTTAEVSERMATLDSTEQALATRQTAAAGTNSGLPDLLGYGLFGTSLVAASAAWTGVGRRLAEYR